MNGFVSNPTANQPNLLELAKQGSPQAIVALMNRHLQPKGILVEANLMDDCFQIILQADQLPNQESLVAFIRKGLMSLGVASIKTVRIYGQQAGKDFPDWTEEFELGEIPVPSLEIKPTQSERSNVQVPKIEPSFEEVRQVNPVPNLIDSAKQQSRESEFIAALQTFQFSSVIPYRQALSPNLYNSRTVKLLLFFGLFPLTLMLVVGRAGLSDVSWSLGAYYASIWGIILYNLIKPVQFSWKDTLKCVFFTAFVGIPIDLFIQTVPPFSFLYAAITPINGGLGLLPKIIGFVFGVGVLEELCKALPIYLFLLRPGKLNDPLTAAFYGAISGLGFAIAEGVSYSFQYASHLATQELSYESLGNYVLINTIRFVSSPLIHAIWAGIVGYFFGLAAINPSRKAPIIFIGVAISAVLHGLYDSFAGTLIGLAIITFSVLLFAAYLRNSKQMVDEMQQAEMSYQASQSR